MFCVNDNVIMAKMMRYKNQLLVVGLKQD